MWFQGLDGGEEEGVLNEGVGKPAQALAESEAVQVVVWAAFAIVERKKWVAAVDTVKIQSRKFADDLL